MAADEGRPVPAHQSPQSNPLPEGDPASLAAMRTAWETLYNAEYHSVVRFVMRTGACLEDARDATEEAFLESWVLLTREPESWSQIRYKPSWIRKVALRKHQRPPGPRRRPLLDGHADIPDLPDPGLEPGELTAQTQEVLHALSSLDPRERTVMAFHMDHFPAAVIADTLGITEQRVRNVTRKARAVLKRTLAAAATPEGRNMR